MLHRKHRIPKRRRENRKWKEIHDICMIRHEIGTEEEEYEREQRRRKTKIKESGALN